MKSSYSAIKTRLADVYLFKRDIHGNVIYWKADVVELHNDFCIRSFYGRLSDTFPNDSAKSISEPINGVNAGKSNATTNEEQSYKELQSEYNDHIKKGYKEYDIISNAVLTHVGNYLLFDNIVAKTNTDANFYAQPMKFKPFYENDRKYPYAGQFKYNGVRCTQFAALSNDLFNTNLVKALSKEGITYEVDHLKDKARKIIDYITDKYKVTVVLDGEYYFPNTPVTTISGAARNRQNPIHKKLQYIIYDLAIDGFNQLERLDMLADARQALGIYYPDNRNTNPDVFISDYVIIKNEAEAITLLERALYLKYEGAIFRPLDKEYAFGKRPSCNKKLKKFHDAEFEIIDVIEYGTRGQNVGYGCKFVCKNDITDGTFEVTVGGNDGTNSNTFTVEDKMKLVDNRELLIGKFATVKFYERSKNNLPFHHNAIAIRDYE